MTIQPAQPAQPPQIVMPKNGAVGVILSFFVPGLGSMVNGSGGRGTIILITWILACVSAVVVVGFILAPAVWIWAMIDGYLAAQRWNRAHGIIS